MPSAGLYLSRARDAGLAFLSQVLLNPIDLHGCDLLSQQQQQQQHISHRISRLCPAAALCCGTRSRPAVRRLCPPLLSHTTIPLQEEFF